MKVAVCSTGDNLDSMTDPRFGRCAYFVVVNMDTMEFEAVSNQAAMAGQGAGIMAAQTVANKGVEAVIAGNFGPNAFQALNAGGIQIYPWAGGTVRQAIEALKAGQLQPMGGPSVQARYGMDQGTGPAPGIGPAQGLGPGMGGGMGRGRGGGRGGGMRRGGGMGGGRGRR